MVAVETTFADSNDCVSDLHDYRSWSHWVTIYPFHQDFLLAVMAFSVTFYGHYSPSWLSSRTPRFARVRSNRRSDLRSRPKSPRPFSSRPMPFKRWNFPFRLFPAFFRPQIGHRQVAMLFLSTNLVFLLFRRNVSASGLRLHRLQQQLLQTPGMLNRQQPNNFHLETVRSLS